MSRQSYLLFLPFLQFSHLRGFATQNFKTVQSLVLISSKMSQESVHGRMWDFTFFLSCFRVCLKVTMCLCWPRLTRGLRVQAYRCPWALSRLSWPLLFPHSSAIPCHLRGCAIEICEIVKCLVFWSSKMHRVVASAHSLFICLFDVSESAEKLQCLSAGWGNKRA